MLIRPVRVAQGLPGHLTGYSSFLMTQAENSWTDDHHSESQDHNILEPAAFERIGFTEGPVVNSTLTGQRQSLSLLPELLLSSGQAQGCLSLQEP